MLGEEQTITAGNIKYNVTDTVGNDYYIIRWKHTGKFIAYTPRPQKNSPPQQISTSQESAQQLHDLIEMSRAKHLLEVM